MADLIFNVAKGRIAHFPTLPAANDALIVVPLLASGLVADATMRDYQTLDAILSGASDENTTMGRKTITSGVTVTPDYTNDRVDIDMGDITWTAAGGGAIAALIVAYDPDTTGGSDSDIIPISKHDFVVTPNGGDIVAQIATSGFARAS